MIRWRFLLTRLVIVIAAIVLLRWGLGPVAQYATTRGLQMITGAKVEIKSTTVGLFPPRVHYCDIAIADPRSDKEMRNAVTADSMELVIDGDALLHRRLVAQDGRITGLKIDNRREASGHLAESAQPKADAGPTMLSRLLSATADRAASQAEALAAELETVRRSKQIRLRWGNEYSALTTRARALEKQIRDVRDRARGIDNPLRDLPECERTLAEARDARNELTSVHQELGELPQRLQADLALLDEAKRADLAKIDRFVPGDLEDASNFGIDMLTQAVRGQINQVRTVLQNGREIAEYTVIAPERERLRGVDYDLHRIQRPSLLVRRCELGGTLRSKGKLYALSGVVENATSTPELLEQPTRTRLSLEGPETVRVEYVRDRRSGADVDLLTVHWPGADAGVMHLGDDGEAALAIAGGQRELWVQLRTAGERIDGRLVSKQTGVEMELKVDDKYAGSAAAKSLEDSLATVDRIEIDANFAGTWRDMELKMNTNLGQIMRRATRDAIDDQIRQTQRVMTAKIDEIHAQQTAELRQWLTEQQSEAAALLASADRSIEEMSAKVLGDVGEADRYIGRLRGAIQGQLR